MNRAILDWDMMERAAASSIGAYMGGDQPDRITFHRPELSATAVLAVTPDEIRLAFKGSKELMDWFQNFRIIPRHYGGAWMHRGFAAAHASLWPDIERELRKHDKPLVVTGHSAGGALAEVSALHLQEYAKRQPVHMITFGKPNVFLKPWAARMPWLATQLSVVNGSDLVARRPRWAYGPDLGQRMLYFANAGNTWLFDSPDDKVGDYTVSQYLAADGRARDVASDHYMSNYFTSIRQARYQPVLVSRIHEANP